MTPDEVEEFQTLHLNHLGKPLSVDRILGPQTRWALDFEGVSLARRAIVVAAQQHIGLTENPIGSNTDPAGLILGWLKACGARLGDAWCAAFASHCLSQSLGPVKIGGAQALGKHFPPATAPCPGDVMWYPTQDWQGHCGVVLGVSAREVMTIEGNCDNAVRCVRRALGGLRFSRTIEGAVGTCPGVVPSVALAGGRTR